MRSYSLTCVQEVLSGNERSLCLVHTPDTGGGRGAGEVSLTRAWWVRGVVGGYVHGNCLLRSCLAVLTEEALCMHTGDCVYTGGCVYTYVPMYTYLCSPVRAATVRS